jgi:hypothetical protein
MWTRTAFHQRCYIMFSNRFGRRVSTTNAP